MSGTAETGTYCGIGFGFEFVRSVIEIGPQMESFYNGMFGALGALVIKLLYDIVVWTIKQQKHNVRERKIEQDGEDGI